MMKLNEEIEKLKKQILSELISSPSAKDIETVKIKYLGRKGVVSQKLKNIKNIKPEERPVYGQLLNTLKSFTEQEISKRLKEVVAGEQEERKFFDWTMPGDRKWTGHIHPLIQTMDEIIEVFLRMGFSIEYGPQIETDFYNFEALNTPRDHPSRDIQDTFYLDGNLLLRTQTSPVQVRVMERTKPPIRIISPGRCYRVDAFDASHSPVFHQIEGLYVDKGVSLKNLTATLTAFAKATYGSLTNTKFVPHYFPFTEPSAEMHVSCPFCKGKGCSTCKHTGWIEILGCGMVHPQVFKKTGIDEKKYTGFAFGMGIERVCMIKYGINDMRLLFENDLRFLEQF